MASLTRLWIISLVLVLAGCASQPVAFNMPPQTFREYADFVASQTPYKNLTEPRWRVVDDALAVPDRERGHASHGPNPAYYDCATRTVYVGRTPYSATVNNLGTASLIVHELTHHAQCLAGNVRTICDDEKEAYAVQAAFLNSVRPRFRLTDQPEIDRVVADVQNRARSACD